MIRVHHLNCVSACPLGGILMDGFSRTSLRGRFTSHCLLLETDRGLVLVDTGYGLAEVNSPGNRLNRFLFALNAPALREDMTAIRQIARLGFDPADVRNIILSHLDFDHAGGLDDFPWARVHLLRSEIEAATAQRSVMDRMRYRPKQWRTRAMWRGYEMSRGEPWFGFDCVRELDGIDRDVVLVPLIGHTLGHAGVAVKRKDGWLLYAGDAYFHHAEMSLVRPRCTPGLKLYQSMMDTDRTSRVINQERLRQLKRGDAGDVTIFCAHDVREFERLAGRAYDEVPGPLPPRRDRIDGVRRGTRPPTFATR